MAGIVDNAVLSYAQMPDSAKIAMLSEALAQLQAEMAVANSRIEEIDGDFPQQILMGGGDDSTATPAEYTSFFKLYDASSADCKIGVEDGGDTTAANCGDVKVNGTVKAITKYASAALTAEGVYRVWLFCWIDETTGAGAEIIVGGAGSATRPAAPVVATPANVLTYGSQLLGRATVASNGSGGYVISAINQDYLRGGEAVEVLFGECGDDVEVEL